MYNFLVYEGLIYSVCKAWYIFFSCIKNGVWVDMQVVAVLSCVPWFPSIVPIVQGRFICTIISFSKLIQQQACRHKLQINKDHPYDGSHFPCHRGPRWNYFLDLHLQPGNSADQPVTSHCQLQIHKFWNKKYFSVSNLQTQTSCVIVIKDRKKHALPQLLSKHQ